MPRTQKKNQQKDRTRWKGTTANACAAILNSMSNAVFVVNTKGSILSANAAAEQLFDMKLSDILDKNAEEVICLQNGKGKDKHLGVLQVIEKGKAKTSKNGSTYIVVHGEQMPVHFSVTPFHRWGSRIGGAVVIISDISTTVEAGEIQDEFVTIVSHQLRTPLAAMKWHLEYMLENIPRKSFSEKDLEYLERTHELNQRMIRLVNDLLSVSRMEAGTIRLSTEAVDVYTLFKNVVRQMEFYARANNALIDFRIKKKDIPRVAADPEKLQLVIENLVSNAIKYTDRKEKVTIKASVKPKKVVFSITDQGIGIPKEESAKVFQPFFRAENAVRTQTDGSGLGLYISKRLLQMNNGNVWFKSDPNRGTTFFFSVPIAAD
ncbi:MAG: PAS domain-containing sensor histidine kinase [Candidatus Kerfeldbacteria bacterium]